MPDDFEISDKDRVFGQAEGLSEAEIARSVEDMRLWAAEAVGEKALRVNWNATARRFMRRDADPKKAGKLKGAKLVELRTNPYLDRSPKSVHVKRDSPQGEAWWKHWKAKTGHSPPMDKDGGWRFPSEWPPVEGEAIAVSV